MTESEYRLVFALLEYIAANVTQNKFFSGLWWVLLGLTCTYQVAFQMGFTR